MDQVLRVLVVDDSAYVRKVVKQMLSRSPFIEVVGTARDGEEALELVEQLKPDVVTLDLVMPGMNGLEFLREQMARTPIPVLLVSISSETSDLALQALEAGAVDLVRKPTALANEKIYEITDELVEKVKSVGAARLKISPVPPGPAPVPTKPFRKTAAVDVLVIGVSTGGPQALKYLIPQFSAEFPVPIVVVLHMPVGYTELYARSLGETSKLKVVEAAEGDEVQHGTLLLAPAGHHLKFRRRPDGLTTVRLDVRPIDTPHRPSVDVLFQSAAEVYGSRVLGVVMTGMGSDGMQGAAWIKAQGGKILTEAEETCVVYGMPRSVVEAGLSDQSIPLTRLHDAIWENL